MALKASQKTNPDTAQELELRFDCPSNHVAKPVNTLPDVQEIQSTDHTMQVTNTKREVILLRCNEHVCQIRPITN